VFVYILSEKAVSEMTYTLLDGTLNSTHSLTHSALGLRKINSETVNWS